MSQSTPTRTPETDAQTPPGETEYVPDDDEKARIRQFRRALAGTAYDYAHRVNGRREDNTAFEVEPMLGEQMYYVHSGSDDGYRTHDVDTYSTYDTPAGACTCRAFKYNTEPGPCKHLEHVALFWGSGAALRAAEREAVADYLVSTTRERPPLAADGGSGISPEEAEALLATEDESDERILGANAAPSSVNGWTKANADVLAYVGEVAETDETVALAVTDSDDVETYGIRFSGSEGQTVFSDGLDELDAIREVVDYVSVASPDDAYSNYADALSEFPEDSADESDGSDESDDEPEPEPESESESERVAGFVVEEPGRTWSGVGGSVPEAFESGVQPDVEVRVRESESGDGWTVTAVFESDARRVVVPVGEAEAESDAVDRAEGWMRDHPVKPSGVLVDFEDFHPPAPDKCEESAL